MKVRRVRDWAKAMRSSVTPWLAKSKDVGSSEAEDEELVREDSVDSACVDSCESVTDALREASEASDATDESHDAAFWCQPDAEALSHLLTFPRSPSGLSEAIC